MMNSYRIKTPSAKHKRKPTVKNVDSPNDLEIQPPTADK